MYREKEKLAKVKKIKGEISQLIRGQKQSLCQELVG